MTRKAKIRFPNESCFDEISIDMDLFLLTVEFEYEVFGWYKGIYISILKESLNGETSK